MRIHIIEADIQVCNTCNSACIGKVSLYHENFCTVIKLLLRNIHFLLKKKSENINWNIVANNNSVVLM